MTPDQAREAHDNTLLNKECRCCRTPDVKEFTWCSELSKICPPEMCDYEGKDGGKCEFQVVQSQCQVCKHIFS